MDPVKIPRDLTKTEKKLMFTNEAQTIINWAGENFYKACDEWVTGDPVNGPATSCVKRVDHAGIIHEDWDGNQKIVLTSGTKIRLFDELDTVYFKNDKYKVGEELISTGSHSEYRYILTPME